MRKALIATTLAAALVVATAPLSLEAGQVRQLTDTRNVSFDWPMLVGDGSEILIVTSSDQFGGGNPGHFFELASIDPATGNGTSLTSFGASARHVRHNLSVSDDGQWLAFISGADLIPGQNGDRSPEAFAMKRDGTGLVQLTNDSTPNPGSVSRLAMAGSGNRVAFVTSSDLTGGNPNHTQQVFLIDRDGGNLTQLTQTTGGEIQHMWVSNDGTRIAFSHNGDLTGGNPESNYEIFTIALGDASPRQVTSSVTGDSQAANISGDGSTIVFHSNADFTGNNPDGGLEIFAADWATATISQVTDSQGLGGGRESRQGWPTDDGQQIFFASNQMPAFFFFEVFKINTDGTGLTQLTSLDIEMEHPVVSGDGSQFAVWNDEGLWTATGNGSNLIQVIDRQIADPHGYPDLSTDGARMVFISERDMLGTNPDGSVEIWTMKTDGTELTQVSESSAFSSRPAISGDGTRVVFESGGDFVGQNPDLNDEVFGVDSDGSNMIQYTDCDGSTGNFSGYPEISDDNSLIVFTSLCDLTGDNPDFTGELFRIDPDGQNLAQITDFPSVVGLTTYVYWPRIDASATWIAMSGNANIAGGNPENNFEVWRIKTDGTGLDQITSETVYNSFFPDISGDGSRIAFTSEADLTGQNADHNYEVFLYEPAAVPQLRQLTQTTVGSSRRPRFSRDGAFIFFHSSSPLVEDDPDAGTQHWLYRYEVDTDTVTRAGGLALEDTSAGYWPAPDDDGSMVAYAPEGDFGGENPDAYWELAIIDYDAPNPPIVSDGPAPTTVSFAAEPGALRYDVIRGDVANLADLGGINVDLGVVECLEDDSGDTDTAGFEDQVTPAAGQVFFYLFRGSLGLDVGPGTYGDGSNGTERLTGAGDCDPS